MATIEQGGAFVLAFVAVAAIAALLKFLRGGGRRSSRRWQRFPTHQRRIDRGYEEAPAEVPRPDLTDAAVQLRAVMAAPFERRQVMNKSEFRVFRIVELELSRARKGYRVFAQTALGQILKSPNELAFRSINAKRSDVMVFDRAGWPVLVVEYQGPGHYQGDAPARDAVKREALRRAGVRYLEITPEHSDDQILARVREELGWNVAEPAYAGGPLSGGTSNSPPDGTLRAVSFGRRRAEG